jgi:hypothetical protein
VSGRPVVTRSKSISPHAALLVLRLRASLPELPFHGCLSRFEIGVLIHADRRRPSSASRGINALRSTLVTHPNPLDHRLVAKRALPGHLRADAGILVATPYHTRISRRRHCPRHELQAGKQLREQPKLSQLPTHRHATSQSTCLPQVVSSRTLPSRAICSPLSRTTW